MRLRFVPAYSLIAVLFTSLVSCQANEEAGETGEPITNNKTVFKKPASGLRDTLRVTGPAAVFFLADSIQLKKVQALTRTAVFESMNHDCFYQMRNARMVLKEHWQKIRVIENSRARWLRFEYRDKDPKIIDLDGNNEICGIYLFDGQKDPQQVDMTNVDSELGFYFQ